MSTTQRYLWTAATTIVVLAGIGLTFLLRPDPATAEKGAKIPDPSVEQDRHYYVLLPVLEVAPYKREPGKSWDFDGSAPDLYYEIFWQGHRVFKSSKKPDTLVAKWSNAAVDLGDLVGSVSLDESIKAARVTARREEEIEFVIYDADVGNDDVVGKWTMPLRTLRVGDQTWHAPADGVISVQCRVLPLDDVGFESLTR